MRAWAVSTRRVPSGTGKAYGLAGPSPKRPPGPRPRRRTAPRRAKLGCRAPVARRPGPGRDNGVVMEMDAQRFEELVAEALDTIPPDLADLMDNVAIFVEDNGPPDEPHLLGLYEGVPLTERGAWYATG